MTEGASDDTFLRQVEESVASVFDRYGRDVEVKKIPIQDRETVSVARSLDHRLQQLRRNEDCPRCWLNRTHCVCARCPPLESKTSGAIAGSIRRIFVLMHHKEICLAVDTAKLILAAFPYSARLVVGGISGEYQKSMKELSSAIGNRDKVGMILFPCAESVTVPEFFVAAKKASGISPGSHDIFVIDGTWQQARKLYNRYFAEDLNVPLRVELSDASLSRLSSGDSAIHGKQLRPHPISWREISTVAALRLLLDEISATQTSGDWSALEQYQLIADRGAQEQLRKTPVAGGQ